MEQLQDFVKVNSSNVRFRRHFLTIVEIFIAHFFYREREREMISKSLMRMDYCNVVLVVHLGYSEPSAIRHSLAFDFYFVELLLSFCSPEIELKRVELFHIRIVGL